MTILIIYGVSTLIYFAIFGFFLWIVPNAQKSDTCSIVLLILVVTGPPLFYGCLHFITELKWFGVSKPNPPVKKIAEIWAPFWAALAAVALAIYAK